MRETGSPTDGGNPLSGISPEGILRLGSKPFREPAARRRFVIGIAVALVPLLGTIALTGYAVRTARHVLVREAGPLPGFRDPLDLFLDAVRVGAVFFVFSIPSNLVGALADSSRLFGLASMVLYLLALLLIPAAILRLADDEFGAAFRVPSHVRRIRRHARLYGRLCAVLAPVVLLQVWAASLWSAYTFLWFSWLPWSRGIELPSLGMIALGLVAAVWCLVVQGVSIGLAGRLMRDRSESDGSAALPASL